MILNTISITPEGGQMPQPTNISGLANIIGHKRAHRF